MNTHETLVAARNLIDRDGWSGEGAGECASNAISKVNPFEKNRYARGELIRAVGVTDLHKLFAWNDAPGRTKQEVLDAYDCAIAATAPEPADPLEGVDVRGVVAP